MKFVIPLMKSPGGGSNRQHFLDFRDPGQRGVRVGHNGSKGAVGTLTKAAAVQHGADTMRVNSVHPG